MRGILKGCLLAFESGTHFCHRPRGGVNVDAPASRTSPNPVVPSQRDALVWPAQKWHAGGWCVLRRAWKRGTSWAEGGRNEVGKKKKKNLTRATSYSRQRHERASRLLRCDAARDLRRTFSFASMVSKTSERKRHNAAPCGARTRTLRALFTPTQCATTGCFRPDPVRDIKYLSLVQVLYSSTGDAKVY